MERIINAQADISISMFEARKSAEMAYPLRFHWLFLDVPLHRHHLGGLFHSQALTIMELLEGGEEGGVFPDTWASERLWTLS